ncbi:hypothetical protein Stok01_02483 [Sulfurisphaera tokodaii]|uniref:hypothetical protein n=1 Tax=Sulfurisphaera tokodaii TaxID=111955 RepID=UPI00069C697F|nr:hypothetical protein [Sulfurisphaera tokodaii]
MTILGIGPKFSDIAEEVLELTKRLDELLEKSASKSEIYEIATEAKDSTKELLFNLERLIEYIEEEQKKRWAEELKGGEEGDEDE